MEDLAMATEHDQSRRVFLGALGAAALGPGALSAAQEVSSAPFEIRIGVCTSARNADLIRAAGGDYIEDSVGRLLDPNKSDADFEEHMRLVDAAPLPVLACNGFIPGSLKSTGPKANHDGVLRYAEIAFRRAKRIGIRHIVFGSSGSRSIPEEFDRAMAELQFASLLGRMGEIAGEHDVVVVIEPLNARETNFIQSVPEGQRFVDAVGHPSIQLLVDVYHAAVMDDPPESVIRAGKRICHSHVAEKEGRTPPGVHGEDLTPYLRALKQIGYRGNMSLECRWNNLEEQAAPAIAALREQIESVA
jgi:sugar phosphate isomerase/epimerase